MQKKVAVVGATGIAGQQFMTALAKHPWFQVVALAGSSRSAGKTYEDALKADSGQINWWQSEPIPQDFRKMKVQNAQELNLNDVDIVFTAIESDAARELEPYFAKSKPTISTASAYRMEKDVPLLIPGVNTDHISLIEKQQQERGWKGFVIPIPNCTTYGLACSLAPLRSLGIKSVIMTSMQATSGAGRHGGVLALDMIDNLVPYIPKEEEKVETETQKILGEKQGSEIQPAKIAVSCTCTRVPVTDGHTETVFVQTEKTGYQLADLVELFRNYQTGIEGLPSAPESFFQVHEDPFRPQPRLDRDLQGGMTTHIGRLRLDPALGGLKYVLLSHNTKAGAAKGAILVAEQLCQQGRI
ncbi:MAG: aspartate-semialdehyde dehydrogenase [Oligoflexus sp.]